ncbi:MAG: hypothetical protein KatS3mg095_0081 [Candidatus Parcubacteria bacterium]|nr:MAG: hypothetical protein KatS3mg095_0081 [Candidatus Parcubacteria bacterium]
MPSFGQQYLRAPLAVKYFIHSQEYYDYLEEYLEKFEINRTKETEFVYFLQDLIFKVVEPKSIMELKDEVKRRFNFSDEQCDNIAYTLFNKFIPQINNLWQQKRNQEIQKPEISNLIKRIKEVKLKTKPSKVLNLQKVIPPKKDSEKTIQAINIQQPEEVKTIKIQIPKIETEGLKITSDKVVDENLTISIPSTKTEGLEPITWQKEEKEKKEKREGDDSKVVIIKKSKIPPQEEGAIDLSNY